MDYSTCMLEWNRVGKGVSMGRFCYHMIKIKVGLSLEKVMRGLIMKGG